LDRSGAWGMGAAVVDGRRWMLRDRL